MKIIFFILIHLTIKVSFLYSSGIPVKQSSRIINGFIRKPGTFPHHTILIHGESAEQMVCGGSLISHRWIITAAHCIENAKVVRARIGYKYFYSYSEKDGIAFLSKELFIHHNYNAEYANYDIALVKTPIEIAYTHAIQPIKLPKKPFYSLVGKTFVVCGFGLQNSSGTFASKYLRWIPQTVISNKQCEDYYFINYIKPSSLCAQGKFNRSTCSGDSGGGLIDTRTNTLIGLVSYGPLMGCEYGIPNGYMKISSYLPWIGNMTDIDID